MTNISKNIPIPINNDRTPSPTGKKLLDQLSDAIRLKHREASL